MHITAPIYVLKRQAKLLARKSGIALNQALDKVAVDSGYQSWSHLASSATHETPAQKVMSRLEPGDLCLLGARPGQGKTLLGLEVASQAVQLDRKGYFFTLDYHERDVMERLTSMSIDPGRVGETLVVDTSDDISAGYIIRRIQADNTAPLIVVDYLQLLDQKRVNPGLDTQLMSLKTHVHKTKAICVVISQIDRTFDLGSKAMPDVSDIRLPNPLDLAIFSKFFFLHQGKIRLDQAA